ncbi:MAG: periplasmic protein TonB [Verrucomicrobiota bacterium]|jgi:TonB family protein
MKSLVMSAVADLLLVRPMPRALLVTLVIIFAGSVGAGEPVMMDKRLLLGGELPRQFRPQYPFEGLSRRLEGAGVFILHVDPKGVVTSITVQKSTGHEVLDSAVLTACVRWRFKPAIVTEVRLPVTFSLRGGMKDGLTPYERQLTPSSAGFSVPARSR